jgi:hypothetical protein
MSDDSESVRDLSEAAAELVRRGQAAQSAVDLLINPYGGVRICAWCQQVLKTSRGRFCGRKHRQAAYRLRLELGVAHDVPRPPRPVRAVFAELDDANAVDVRLLARLRRADGWALACTPGALRWVLPKVAPRGARDVAVCAWWAHKAGKWGAIVVKPARPGARPADTLPLPGEDPRPPLWGAWVVRWLGIVPGDTLDELGPRGAVEEPGIVTRARAEIAPAGAPGWSAEHARALARREREAR